MNLLERREVIYKFAIKWRNIYYKRSFPIEKEELILECREFAFESKLKDEFINLYGNAYYDYGKLRDILGSIGDIDFLASVIYARILDWDIDLPSGKPIKEGQKRYWFYFAFNHLARLAGENLLPFEGIVAKISIVSSDTVAKKQFDTEKEIEHHIDINHTGKLLFTAYNFHESLEYYDVSRCQEHQLELLETREITRTFSDFFRNCYKEMYANDKGIWTLEITNRQNISYYYRGSFDALLPVEDTDLSNFIRSRLKIKDLLLFDGNLKSLKMNRIHLEYVRTLIYDDEETDIYKEVVYKEFLIIDRKTELLEHIQMNGPSHTIKRTVNIPGIVKMILDGFDSRNLFAIIDGYGDGYLINPFDKKEYTITIDFDSGEQRSISGSFDQRGLPRDWPYFAKTVLNILLYYGLADIFDSTIYEEVLRHKNEHIYLSLQFHKSKKTYYYLTDNESIKIGDYVVVPVGTDNDESVAKVEKIEFFSYFDAPIEVEKTKKVIRKATKKEIDIFWPK